MTTINIRFFLLISLLTLFVFCPTGNVAAKEFDLNSLHLPPGFKISRYVENIQNPREMALGDRGTIFVGTMNAGKVYAVVPDPNPKSKQPPKVYTIAENLNMPNGVAFLNHDLYVAEVSRILRYKNIEDHLNDPSRVEVVLSSLPTETHHGWRFIGFGPDKKLYIGVGAPCNVCDRTDFPFASIMRVNSNGTNLEVYARGIRNTVGFDWQPSSNQLWFTDNGRDLLGDNIPPDELNRAPVPGMHFGFPYCHGKNIPDPEFGKQFPCSSFTPPVVELPAHVAALGMTFYQGQLFPREYSGSIFIAEHGSWNRSTKIGYQVINIKVNGNVASEPTPFVTGWLQGDQVYGRPVDVLTLKDGSLLISDDFGNTIYRVTFGKP